MKKKKQDSNWKDRLFKFEKEKLNSQIYLGVLAVFIGGLFIGGPLGAVAQLTKTVSSSKVSVNLADATLGAALGAIGVLLFFVGALYIYERIEAYKQLKRA